MQLTQQEQCIVHCCTVVTLVALRCWLHKEWHHDTAAVYDLCTVRAQQLDVLEVLLQLLCQPEADNAVQKQLLLAVKLLQYRLKQQLVICQHTVRLQVRSGNML
jgi:hypothetical protein